VYCEKCIFFIFIHKIYTLKCNIVDLDTITYRNKFVASITKRKLKRSSEMSLFVKINVSESFFVVALLTQKEFFSGNSKRIP